MKFDFVTRVNGDFCKVGTYEITPMPGCARVGISHGFQIYPPYRGQGFGTACHEERLRRARNLDYEYLLCTVVETNYAEKAILQRSRWRPITTFPNRRTGNEVEFWIKQLNDPYAELYGDVARREQQAESSS